MTKKRLLKYFLLLALGIITLRLKIEFGDYCEGMAKGLLYVLTVITLFLIFLIITCRDVYKMLLKKEKFDFVPLAILMFFILANGLIIFANENNFWKKIKLEGRIEDENARARIIFYENMSFEAIKSEVESRCIYTGKYRVENNLYILEHKDIEQKTDLTFTKKYIFLSDSILQPLDKSYSKIKIDAVLPSGSISK